MRTVIGLALSALVLAISPVSAATYLFSYGFNGATIASGTITTDDSMLFPGAANVVDVQGTRDGAAITGFQGYFDLDVEAPGDQQLYPNRPAAYVDTSGLTFEVGDMSYSIASPSADSGGGPDGSYYEFGFLTADPTAPGVGQYVSFFTLAPAAAAVPEAAGWTMLLLGFGMIGTALRRRPRAAYAPASALSR